MNKTKLLAIIRKLEWRGETRGQGYGFMGSGGDGPIVRCCPLCRGIDPTDDCRAEFIESAWDHKDSCNIKRALQEG
jgi:hypothetical protein